MIGYMVTLGRAAFSFAIFGAHTTKTTAMATSRKLGSSLPLAAGSQCIFPSYTTSSSCEPRSELDRITHPSYDILSKEFVKEYDADCTLYRHKQCGAELLSVSNQDDNKVFGITFRTPPEDSTGLPHIMEHSVLCGSRKYKTKDPFVKLLQGSLQTFLNAFTYPDRTCYVVASQNTQDFYNLIHVYTDAVFHPRAIHDPNVLAQEGWHLELGNKEDPLLYNGVVYNEMKGVYSSPDSLQARHSQTALFPDTAYVLDSGGDPTQIPNLSFSQFKDFHRKFYHPANSWIYFAGDDDVRTRLDMMDDYLKEFDASPESKVGSAMQWQSKIFTSPHWSKYVYPVSVNEDTPSKDMHMVIVNWLLNDQPFTPTEDLTVRILDQLLLGTVQSMLYKKLIESNYGTTISGGGLSDELLQHTFSIGLKGVHPDNVEKVQSLIVSILQTAVKDGFDNEEVEAAMNTLEFRLREFNTGSFPRGLSLMLGAMTEWIYGGSPTEAIKFESALKELKVLIADQGDQVFRDFIQTYLLDNTHRVTIEMVPDETLEHTQLTNEQDRLSKVKSSFQDEQLEDTIRKTQELKKVQSTEDTAEDRATIPALALSDMTPTVTEYPSHVTENAYQSGVTMLYHELPSTSGIVYAKFGVDVSQLSIDDLSLLPLFCRILTETGVQEYSDVEFTRYMGIHTGGVSTSFGIRSVRPSHINEGTVHDGSHLITKLFINGKSTSEKAHTLLDIFQKILTGANLDSQTRVLEILRETKDHMETNVQTSGHVFANSRLKARYSIAGYLDEKIGGFMYLSTVTDLLQEAEDHWDSVLARLVKIRATLLNDRTCRDGMVLDLTGDASVLNTIASGVEQFLTHLPGTANASKLPNPYSTPHPWAAPVKLAMPECQNEGFSVPTQVSYVGKGGRIFQEGEYVSGSSAVVSRYLRTAYLWDHVRVMGGAYGAFCSFNPRDNDGILTYMSYRDPNLQTTLTVYDQAADALDKAADLMENDSDVLANAIIGTVGDLETALSPDLKGAVAFNRWMAQESPEYRQKFRKEVLDTKPSDFRSMADKLRSMKHESVAVVSSKAKLEEAVSNGLPLTLTQI